MNPPDYARPALMVLGVAILAAAVVPLVGYGFSLPKLYEQPGGTGMALMTAVCFFLVGLGFLMIAKNERK